MARAAASGLLLEPVIASCVTGTVVVGALAVVMGAPAVVDVEPSGPTGLDVVVDVEPNGVTGVVTVDVVTGIVDVAPIVVVGATVVVATCVVLVVGGGPQSDNVSAACADPGPSDEVHESMVLTVCVPDPSVSATVSVACGPVNVKSRVSGLSESTVIDSWAVIDSFGKL
jgi:hypothetical protein